MKVALCVIATGKYTRFLACLLESAAEFFCAGHERRVLVFTDAPGDAETRGRGDAEILLSPRLPLSPSPRLLATPREPWPGPTLHRYRTMLRAAGELLDCDYVYYVDVDSRFVRPVGSEIFGDLAATLHFGFHDRPRSHFTYEDRPASRACIRPHEGRRYYCGGFQGGRAETYVEAMRAMDAAIAADERRGITAWWHDESHWNRYLVDHPPTLELSLDYTCPPQWRPETQRIVIVNKDCRELRS